MIVKLSVSKKSLMLKLVKIKEFITPSNISKVTMPVGKIDKSVKCH